MKFTYQTNKLDTFKGTQHSKQMYYDNYRIHGVNQLARFNSVMHVNNLTTFYGKFGFQF